MELVIAKWKQPHNGAEYTMHFAEDANWFTIICEIDEVGDPKCCEIRLIDTWGHSNIDVTSYDDYIDLLKFYFNNLGTEVTLKDNNQTKEKYEQLA